MQCLQILYSRGKRCFKTQQQLKIKQEHLQGLCTSILISSAQNIRFVI